MGLLEALGGILRSHVHELHTRGMEKECVGNGYGGHGACFAGGFSGWFVMR